MDDIQDRIAWNSALNNAVHIVGVWGGFNLHIAADVTAAKANIESWQAYFYKNLTQRKTVDRKLASEKGRDDAEMDVGQQG